MGDDSKLRMEVINLLWMNCHGKVTLDELQSRACKIMDVVKDAPKE